MRVPLLNVIYAEGWDHYENCPLGAIHICGSTDDPAEVPALVRAAWVAAVRRGWGEGHVYVLDPFGCRVGGRSRRQEELP